MAATARTSHPNQNGHCSWPSFRGRPISQLMKPTRYELKFTRYGALASTGATEQKSHHLNRTSASNSAAVVATVAAPTRTEISCRHQPPPHTILFLPIFCKSASVGAVTTNSPTAIPNTTLMPRSCGSPSIDHIFATFHRHFHLLMQTRLVWAGGVLLCIDCRGHTTVWVKTSGEYYYYLNVRIYFLLLQFTNRSGLLTLILRTEHPNSGLEHAHT